ncbi:acyl-CoA N-acyltransferase [Colletotrichum godetiae]|uniref:Acyl-CoA N-acyltransferase n=1 Tax=Colletotrichum godetiae TaxID=1209918 RepID=A0AAJ0EW91_9PEZI|nr:acyl-CoA N-acyltransferase [Colletotrichum godetiae]KAK1673959.1 acyl-CoA N-acyltransferase [Colletotrichum godetiae]
MAPAKRKRPHDDPEPPPPTATGSAVAAGATPADPTTTRRATRQTPILPPPIPTSVTASHSQPLHTSVAATATTIAEDKRTSGRRPSNSKPYPPSKISETPIPVPVPPTSSSSASHLAQQQPSIPRPIGQVSTPTPQEPRVTRQRRESANDSSPQMAFKDAKENIRPVTLVAPKITYQAPQTQAHRNRTGGSLVRPSPPTSQPPITQHFRPISTTTTTTTTTTRPTYHHTIPATVTAVPVPVHPTSTSTSSKPAAATTAPPPPPRTADKSAPRTDRNIDKVMLGNICFRAWYPSYYGKEVLGEAAGAKASGGGSKNPLAHHDVTGGANSSNGGAKNQHRKGGDAPMLDRLYVCPMCFKYSKELVAWWGHVRMCERNGVVPGRKVYRHPKGRRLVRKEIARTTGKKTNVAPKYTEEYVTDEGEWSVWEVDGEQDVLFCQNLSLFAKLFLDNKSVFFDVRGFNYFLLVYTPPAPKPTPNPVSHQDPSQSQPPPPSSPPPRPHIVGFFSKEKMSWDNNNLACILVFPPWQKKGLGALLMGVSYEISRREGVLGGPEKPISELGRKGYKRFWGGEVARWVLGCPSNGRGGNDADPALLVDLEDCSRSTWIALEDCLATLKEMGVVVEAGRGPGKPPAKKRRRKRIAGEDGVDGGEEAVEEEEEDGDVEMEEADAGPRPGVPRVRVDKAAVWAWVAANGISLERICDPDGFVEGYAIKQPDVEEDDE